MNAIRIVDQKQGITPLVCSSKGYEEGCTGIDNYIVAWTYARPAGGRSLVFTGLDAHSAWERPGLRQLMVNGVTSR